eukprot:CAMPEP_0202967612 /NCGR_PEP_ID=MMETSP1396-20130829/12538_1 /ASSEMBLY_ACC=CAM_ASM_000872 /TAXON_ID= /ORGANISM="Pseudokeronopsis sp., Strain Brazil" /LENGTH=46 /DNA_ID= /DNA_START= /DNA_END= /DNA_ORIENTATION=
MKSMRSNSHTIDLEKKDEEGEKNLHNKDSLERIEELKDDINQTSKQ